MLVLAVRPSVLVTIKLLHNTQFRLAGLPRCCVWCVSSSVVHACSLICHGKGFLIFFHIGFHPFSNCLITVSSRIVVTYEHYMLFISVAGAFLRGWLCG